MYSIDKTLLHEQQDCTWVWHCWVNHDCDIALVSHLNCRARWFVGNCWCLIPTHGELNRVCMTTCQNPDPFEEVGRLPFSLFLGAIPYNFHSTDFSMYVGQPYGRVSTRQARAPLCCFKFFWPFLAWTVASPDSYAPTSLTSSRR